ALNNLKSVISGTDSEDIKKKSEELKQASYKLAEEMYKNASKSTDQQGGGATTQDNPNPDSNQGYDNKQKSSSGDNIEDADYEVVDDNKK
ncbi:MAG: molecular chaperone DnaK, partial [Spirochaetaceae bacterium]|nr:molecular chaperone DnaK [Spirochaetaceae bacterium]